MVANKTLEEKESEEKEIVKFSLEKIMLANLSLLLTIILEDVGKRQKQTINLFF